MYTLDSTTCTEYVKLFRESTQRAVFSFKTAPTVGVLTSIRMKLSCSRHRRSEQFLIAVAIPFDFSRLRLRVRDAIHDEPTLRLLVKCLTFRFESLFLKPLQMDSRTACALNKFMI